MSKNQGKKSFPPKWPLIISVLISVSLLGYLLSQIKLKTFLGLFSNLFLGGLFIYLLLATINIWVRAYRYQILIGREKIKLGALIPVTLVRNCAVDLFPGRLGELIYIYLLRQRYQLPLKSATASFVLSILFDYLAVAPIILTSIFFVRGSWVSFFSPVFLIFQLMGLVLLAGLIFWLPHFLSFGQKTILKFFQAASANKFGNLLEEMKLEIFETQKRKIYFFIFFISIVIRGLKYASLFFLASAFFNAYNISWKNLSFFHITLGTVGAELTTFLPFKGIAGLGTWESGWVVVMRLLNYPKEWGIATGLGVHLVTQIFEYFLGALALIYIYLKNPRKTEE